MKTRPNILTIAGFDPSNGAGLTADIKTFEALKCYGLAVCTANTVQNDIEFKDCHWISKSVIKKQIEVLFTQFKIDVVKIGIVENWKILSEIVDFSFSSKANTIPICFVSLSELTLAMQRTR